MHKATLLSSFHFYVERSFLYCFSYAMEYFSLYGKLTRTNNGKKLIINRFFIVDP